MEPYVALTLAAALLFAIGNSLQKDGISRRIGPLSTAAMVDRPLRLVARLARCPIWMLGTAVTLVAVGVETQALGSGDLTVVKPLSRVQSVFVVVIGVVALGESLAGREWLGIAVLVLGALLLASQPADAVPYAPETATSGAVAIGIAVLVVLLLLLADRSANRLRGELGLAVGAGCLFALGDAMVKMGTEIVRGDAGSFDLWRPGTASALFGTLEFQLGFLASAGAFLVQQIAFSRGRVSIVAPIIGTAGTLLLVALGHGLLREPLGMTRAAGIAVVLAGGILLLARASGGEDARLRA